MKNYLKTGILLFGILISTTNCEKENIIDNPIKESTIVGTKIEYISFNDAPKVLNAITALTGESSLKKTIYSKTLSYKKAHIDVEKILKVKNEKNITNYTFNVFIENSPINEFYNLIVNEDSTNKIKKPYVIKYVVDDDALDNFLANKGDFSYFKGKTYILSFNSFFDSFDIQSKSSADLCPPFELDNIASSVPGGSGGSGGIQNIPGDNFIQTDAYSYNYGVPNAGDSYTLYYNSHNTSTGANTSYTGVVTNVAITYTINGIGQITVNENMTLAPLNLTRVDIFVGSGGDHSTTKFYNDLNWTTQYGRYNFQQQLKQTYNGKTESDLCPIPEGEVGVISTSLAAKEIYLCLGDLTTDQISFLQSSSTTIDIYNFLITQNNCTIEAKLFAKSYIELSILDIDNLTNEDIESFFNFNKDYKNRMSVSERVIFNNMSKIKQMGYLFNAQKATWRAKDLYPNSLTNGKGDAFRHAFFNGLNAILLGVTLAESLATAHEDKPADYLYFNKETEMDLFNNLIGRKKRNWFQDGFNSLDESIISAMGYGQLRYLSNLEGGGSSGRATNLSSLTLSNN